MTRDVLISVMGLQFSNDGERDSIETITNGQYYKKNQKHYLLFQEVEEGFSESTSNIIKAGETIVDITKRGVNNTHMVFEKNKKNLSYYYTPYGSLMFGIDTTGIKIQETEDNIDIEIDYILDVNYEYMADCKIVVKVSSKEAGNFKL